MDISVIVPVYNAAEYLPECMKSLLAQRGAEFEVILSDDGSSDGGGALCDAYARKYPSFKVVHAANAGPAAARNRALDLAAGEYIFFLDSDDVLAPEAFGRLLLAARDSGADFVVGDFSVTAAGRRNRRKDAFLADGSRRFGRAELVTELERFLLAPRGASFFTNVWGKLYRRDTIERHSLRFAPELKTWEDTLFNFDFCGHAGAMYYLREQLYEYRIHEEKISGGARILDHPFGHRRVLDSIRGTLLAAGRDPAALENMIRHAEVYFAVKNLIVCSVLRRRGKVPPEFDLRAMIRNFAADPALREALGSYRRAAGESFWIPFLLRWSAIPPLEAVCRLKAWKIESKRI